MTALYATVVTATLVATNKANSSYLLAGGLALGFLWVVSSVAYALLPNQAELYVQGLASISVFGFFYFMWWREDAQHKDLFAWLAFLAFGTTTLYLFMAVAPLTPLMREFGDYWWFKIVNNRLFDLQLLSLLVYSRLRVLAHQDRAAWRAGVFALHEKLSSRKKDKTAANKDTDDPENEGNPYWGLTDDAPNDGVQEVLEMLRDAVMSRLGRKRRKARRRAE